MGARLFPRCAKAVLLAALAMQFGSAFETSKAASFTYQGRLMDGPVPANGLYDLRFRLFNALGGGAQVGADFVSSPVGVTNGLFTVSLEFGNDAFNGADRWLEIGARSAGDTNAHVTLAPRQPITAVPYALFSYSGTGDAGALTSGIVPDARLGATIARSADVLASSNVMGARLVATNAVVQAQLDAMGARIEQLASMVLAMSNQLSAAASGNPVMASRAGDDPAMAASGMVRFARLDGGGWRDGSATGAPSPRTDHVTVWTGRRLWAWGGKVGGMAVNTGAEYDPASDSWAPVSGIDAPTSRSGAASAWAGDRVIVWGGFGNTYLGDGATYNPSTLQWLATPVAGAPSARLGHASAWTGARFVVWGGRNATGLLADGGILDLGPGSWTPLPVANAPAARRGATCVWTGNALLFFGGEGVAGELADGAALPMAGGLTPGSWQALSTVNAPGARTGHTAVWTGNRMLVWGGARNNAALGDGAAYDPSTDSWKPISNIGAPEARSGHLAIWTGKEMVVFGGENNAGPIASAASYDPARDAWTPLGQTGTPVARSGGGGAWTGDELIVFGGRTTGNAAIASLQRLNPQAVWYLYRKP